MLSCCKHQERISAQEGCCEHRASSGWAVIARHRNRGAEGLVLGSRCPGVFVLEMLPAGGLLEGREGGKLPACCVFSSLSVVCSPRGKDKPRRAWGRAEEMCSGSKYGLVIYQCGVIEVISCRF